jgi:serine phosphatase RsbU (regulator of sigma subunit)
VAVQQNTWRAIWARLTTPAGGLEDAEDTRKAHSLASLSLSLTIILLLAAVVSAFTSIVFPDPSISLGLLGTVLIGVTALGFLAAYHYSTTVQYKVGAWLTIVTIYTFLTGFMLFYPRISASLTIGYVVPVLAATIFLNSNGTIRVFVITLILTALMLPIQGITIVNFAVYWIIVLVVTSLTVMVAVLRDQDLAQVKRLRLLEATEAERLRRELDLARKVQLSMLPKNLPDIPSLDLAAYSQPAFEASGDFYDIFELSSHDRLDHRPPKLGIVVCDVAGKGVSAALIMAATRAAIRAEVERSHSPARVLEKVNDLLAESLPSGLFVTTFYGIYDREEGILRYASAGHPHPFWWNGAQVSELENFGMPLGLVAGSEYQNVEAQLSPGEAIFIYTDGLVEALNPRREMYGFDTAQKNVEQYVKQPFSADDLVKFTLRDMDIFVEGEHQQDDVTIVVLRVKQPDPIVVA